MPTAAMTPELSFRRIKHGHRQRRPRNLELGHPSAEHWMVQARSSVLIALIDPKPLTRESILKMLGMSLPANVTLVGTSSFKELAELERPEGQRAAEPVLGFVILYIRNAGVSDHWVQEELQLIKSQQPQMPVIMISDREDADDVIKALSCGVRGYIPTSIATEVAIAALTLIEVGGTYVPADALLHEVGDLTGTSKDEEPVPIVGDLSLTSRELAVIDLLREGNANKLIAKKLNMRESTVKVHVRNILKKLGVSNRTHAATVANRLLAQGARRASRDEKHLVLAATNSGGKGH